MNNNLTTQELEALAQAWFDGLLTREEESVLKRVLSDTAPHSPLLDECRLAMGFESAAQHCRQGKRILSVHDESVLSKSDLRAGP